MREDPSTFQREGSPRWEHDPRTGEIVVGWYYYVPDAEAFAYFSERLDASAYVTGEQLSHEYRLTQTQRHALGAYDQCADRPTPSGRWHTTYWWTRAKVEQVIHATPGTQGDLFA